MITKILPVVIELPDVYGLPPLRCEVETDGEVFTCTFIDHDFERLDVEHLAKQKAENKARAAFDREEREEEMERAMAMAMCEESGNNWRDS